MPRGDRRTGSIMPEMKLSFRAAGAAGIPIEPGNNPKQMFLTGPDDVRVEIIEDASISTPVAMHHIHMFLPDPLAAQAWYGKHFGAIAGKRGMFDTATVPGAEFTFTKNDMPQAPTKGRSVDHIGFEVKNIDQFVKTLDARRRVLGPEHPNTLRAMNNLALLYLYQGKYAQAEPLFHKLLEVAHRVMGEEHPDALTYTNNLALLYDKLGKAKEAIRHMARYRTLVGSRSN